MCLPFVFEEWVEDEARNGKYKAEYSKQTVDHCESNVCMIHSINWATIIGYISSCQYNIIYIVMLLCILNPCTLDLSISCPNTILSLMIIQKKRLLESWLHAAALY
jgi:hypothetical protein